MKKISATYQQKMLIISMLFSVFLTYSQSPTEPVYAVLFITTIFIFFIKIKDFFVGVPCYVHHSKRSGVANFLTYSWILMILMWVYGVIVGIARDVELDNVFRNFFGLLLYILLPVFLIIKPRFEQLIYFLKISAVIQVVYLFVYLSPMLLDAKVYVGGGLSSLRYAYSVGFLIFFPLVSISLGRYIFEINSGRGNVSKSSQSINSFFFSPFSMIFYTILTILATMSKGYILAFFMLYLSLMLTGFSIKVKKNWVVSIIIMIIFFGTFIFLYYDIILFTFSSEEVSNSVRALQYDYLISEWTVLGNGLGAQLDSGYSRDVSGYGFELTYLNLIHKLGIFTIPLFFTYLICIIVPLYHIFNRKHLVESLFAFGLMSFLIVGSGNPILLSPLAVLFHATSIYIVINNLKNKRM